MITHPIIIKAAEAAGSQSELARQLGIDRSALHRWTRVPAERVREVERITGIPRVELRPDLYGEE